MLHPIGISFELRDTLARMQRSGLDRFSLVPYGGKGMGDFDQLLLLAAENNKVSVEELRAAVEEAPPCLKY